jgi:hypothetical protein
MEKMLDLYTDYLLSSFGQTSATGLSNLVDGLIQHDTDMSYLQMFNQFPSDGTKERLFTDVQLLTSAPLATNPFFVLYFFIVMLQERINFLKNVSRGESLKIRCYNELSELEKIPFRVQQAEILALEEFIKNGNLSNYLEVSVKYENYCGAEGIKKAKEWLSLKGFIV